MEQTPVTNPDGTATRPARPRFRWPMRVFLSLVLFDMVFHSLGALTDYRRWSPDLGLRRNPLRLPTGEELGQLERQATPDDPDPATDRVMATLDSVWDFFKPWPSAANRRRIAGWQDGTRFAFCWLMSRLEFGEHLAGIRQQWTMFSPTVRTQRVRPRARLEFADGSTRQVRLDTSDPEDLTRYSHWLVDRVNNYEVEVGADEREACLGLCNLLAHRHRTSARGRPLARIYLFPVRYYLPAPGVDAAAFLRRQSGPPADQVGPPFFVAEVKTGPDGSVSVRPGKL
jgi:hypothetical protein